MGKELVIERVFDAPVERVWKAWTEPEQVMKWWGPKGFSAPVIEIDFRIGGKYLYCMRASDEMAKMLGRKDFWNTGTYKEIVPHKKLVATDSFADEKGNVVPAAYYGMSKNFALESTVTIIFEEQHDGRTKTLIRYSGVPEGETMEQASQGWEQSLDKLADSLAT
ncbi:MAG: SRPBCC family protein [Candidatus Micrarchaeales archaeon]